MVRKRVSIRDLETATGIHRSAISRRLNTPCPFTVDQIVAIARALEVPPSTLLPADETAA